MICRQPAGGLQRGSSGAAGAVQQHLATVLHHGLNNSNAAAGTRPGVQCTAPFDSHSKSGRRRCSRQHTATRTAAAAAGAGARGGGGGGDAEQEPLDGYTPADYVTFSDAPDKQCHHSAEVVADAPVAACYALWSEWSTLLEFLDLVGQIGLDGDNPNLALFQCFYRYRKLPLLELVFLLERQLQPERHSIAFESVYGMPIKGQVKLEEQADGTTRVRLYFTHPIPTVLVQLRIGPFGLETDMAAILADNLAAFKQLAEAGVGPDWQAQKQQVAARVQQQQQRQQQPGQQPGQPAEAAGGQRQQQQQAQPQAQPQPQQQPQQQQQPPPPAQPQQRRTTAAAAPDAAQPAVAAAGRKQRGSTRSKSAAPTPAAAGDGGVNSTGGGAAGAAAGRRRSRASTASQAAAAAAAAGEPGGSTASSLPGAGSGGGGSSSNGTGGGSSGSSTGGAPGSGRRSATSARRSSRRTAASSSSE